MSRQIYTYFWLLRTKPQLHHTFIFIIPFWSVSDRFRWDFELSTSRFRVVSVSTVKKAGG